MQINRHNYEEFFLLYVDNELSAEQKAAVETFISENSDLAGELEMMQQSVFLPDESVAFDHKNLLMQAEGGNGFIDAFNAEELFVQYSDDELSNDQKAEVEQFVYRNPQFQAGFELFQQTRLTPDTSVVFPGKESLYKHEEERRIIPIRWWRMAAAAVILLVGGLVWLNSGEGGNTVDPGKLALAGQKNNDSNRSKKVDVAKNDAGSANDNASATASTDVVAETNSADDKQQQKNVVLAVTKTKVNQYNKQGDVQDPVETTPIEKPERQLEGLVVKGGVIDNKRPDVASNEINTSEEKKVIIDQPQPLDVSSTTDTYISYASNNDDVLISNVAVDKKNSLRGIFRKAGRFIEKTTNVKPGEKGIQIGAFTIAGK